MKLSTVVSPAIVAGQHFYRDVNCYREHGALQIDYDPLGSFAEAECIKQCMDDASCEGIVRETSSGNCWRRAAIALDLCDHGGVTAMGYDTWVKQITRPSVEWSFEHEGIYPPLLLSSFPSFTQQLISVVLGGRKPGKLDLDFDGRLLSNVSFLPEAAIPELCEAAIGQSGVVHMFGLDHTSTRGPTCSWNFIRGGVHTQMYPSGTGKEPVEMHLPANVAMRVVTTQREPRRILKSLKDCSKSREGAGGFIAELGSNNEAIWNISLSGDLKRLVAGEGRLYVHLEKDEYSSCGEDAVLSLDMEGNEVWRLPLSLGVLHASNPDGTVYVQGSSGESRSLIAVDLNGEVQWNVTNLYMPINVLAAVDSDNLFLHYCYKAGFYSDCDLGESLVRVNGAGDITMNFTVPRSGRSPMENVIVDAYGNVYFTIDSSLVAVSNEGKELWRVVLFDVPMDPSPTGTPTYLFSNLGLRLWNDVLVATVQNEVHCISLDGVVQWSFISDDGFFQNHEPYPIDFINHNGKDLLILGTKRTLYGLLLPNTTAQQVPLLV